MDKIISTALCLFILILAPFAGILAYNGYVETAYRNTITGTYNYSCTISTDAPMYNVTFFIPVPADRTGNSPVVSAFSNKTMNGVPADWETTLFDTGKSTMLKVTTAAILPPGGGAPSGQYTVTFSSATASRSPIDTRNPVEKSPVFRPLQDLRESICMMPGGTPVPCSVFNTTIYMDYQASPDVHVTIESALTGRNTWTVFEPHANEYRTVIRLATIGESHGWATAQGELSCGTGNYDSPFSV